jgi:hypothetical protein
MGGLLGGLLAGLVIALAFLKYENHPKIRWTIRLVLLGIGAALLPQNSSNLGGLIAILIIYPLVFGLIGVVIDLVKNSSQNKQVATTTIEQLSKKMNHSNVEKKSESQPTASLKKDFRNTEVQTKTDDDLWADALIEFESAKRKKGLYAKLYSLHTGDEAKIKAAYLQERHFELKEEQLRNKANEEALTREKDEYEKKLLSLNTNEKLVLELLQTTSIKKVGNTDFYMYDDGRVALKVNEAKFALYANFQSAENAISYSNLNGVGFIGFITIIKE